MRGPATYKTITEMTQQLHAARIALEACHELGVEPGELVERVRQTVEALTGLITVDWNLERGNFYDPETYAGKVWAHVRAALALWATTETPAQAEKGRPVPELGFEADADDADKDGGLGRVGPSRPFGEEMP